MITGSVRQFSFEPAFLMSPEHNHSPTTKCGIIIVHGLVYGWARNGRISTMIDKPNFKA